MTKKKSFEYSFELQEHKPVQAVEQMTKNAINFHQQGNLQQAVQAYRQILAIQPGNAYVLNLLGILISQAGNYTEGEKIIREAIRIEPDSAEYHINLGFNLQHQARHESAEQEFEKATQLAPGSADAWFNLGSISLFLKKPEQAINSFKKAVDKNKNHLPAYNNLGNIYREMRKYDDALEMFNKVLKLKPDLPQAWYNLGMTYKNMEDGENAIKCFEKVLAYDPANLKARCQIGDCRGRLLNDMNGAFKDYDAVIKTNPEYVAAYSQKGDLLLTYGRYDEAESCFHKALDIDQSNTTSYAGLVSCRRYNTEDIQKMIELPDHVTLTTRQLVDIHFSLGSVFDIHQDYEKAFQHFQRGNQLHRGTYEYNVRNFEQYTSKLINKFDTSLFSQNAKSGVNSDLPVFIVGMPRSGTTLVEQIIASHPRVFGAGELPHISNLIQSSITVSEYLADSGVQVIPELTKSDVHQLANRYLTLVGKHGSCAARITDKMPQNFVHLGYIAMMFPQARIIHCSRNPMDTCSSIYMQKFTQHHPYAYDLEELGTYYRQYQRLMSHWEMLLGSRIFTIQYEDLVADLEGKSRELINHIGLDWDDHCLHFHETSRSVQTASHMQVRQNIYTSSLGRWRNYERWLGPLRSVLGQ